MSSCSEIRDELKAYADGELAGSLRGSVRQHVERCAACGRELEEIQTLSRQLRELDTAMPRPELRSRILAHVPVEIQTSRRPSPWWRTPGFAFGLGSAACALLLLVVMVPRASEMEEDLSAVQERLDSENPAPTPAVAGNLKKVRERSVTQPMAQRNGTVVKLPDSAAKDVRKPAEAPVNSPSAPPAPALKELPPTALRGRRPMALPGLAESLDKPKAPEGELLATKPVEKRDEGRGGAALGQIKTETAAGLPAPQPSAPKQAPAGPGGGLGGGTRAPQQPVASDENTSMLKLQSNRSNSLGTNASQTPQANYRVENVEATVFDLESAANGILFYAQDEGGKPMLPERQAEPGSDEMVLTLLVPAEKVDAIRSKLTQYRTLSLGKEQKDVYQLGAVIGRQQSERGIKNQLDNRAYFGHVAPRDSVQREAIRARDIVAAPRGQSTLEEQKGGFADLDAAKVNAPPAGGARSLPANRSSLFSARTLKKQNEELVRLVIKLRTPPKPAPVKRKGKE